MRRGAERGVGGGMLESSRADAVNTGRKTILKEITPECFLIKFLMLCRDVFFVTEILETQKLLH
jgi:hypothetical protein